MSRDIKLGCKKKKKALELQHGTSVTRTHPRPPRSRLRAPPPSATILIHIFKAYNNAISERGLDAENEVECYKKLLKIGTLKGENWASKWRAVKAQNGYTSTPTSAPPGTRFPPHHSTLQTPLFSSKVTVMTPPVRSTTARLLQRLKGLRYERFPPNPPNLLPTILLAGWM